MIENAVRPTLFGLSPVITPFSIESNTAGATLIASLADTLWTGMANRAFYYPFRLGRGITTTLAFLYNGVAVAGNFDIGVYSVAGARIGATGAIAQAGVTQVQTQALAISFGPGTFYLALSMSDATARIWDSVATIATGQPMGQLIEAAANPLPATMTPTVYAGGHFWLFGIVLSPRTFV